ncbi:MAG: RluA family pseudouridine synthase [Spirochaetes bacterium]|nr:RluA family pseudouridine synthase [Spirochaetota bacterium]
MENTLELTVSEEFNLERIDKFLIIAAETDFSRSYLQKLIKNGHITVNGNSTKQNYKVKTDDIVLITFPVMEKLDLEPENLPLNILFQDSDIAVIHKQPGLVVHPGAGNYSHTLVNALLFHIKDLSGIGGVERPGIVHRLDKDTEGLMIIAKNDNAHQKLVEMFTNRELTKEYHALVTGRPSSPEFKIEKSISRHPKFRYKMTINENGKYALTTGKIVQQWNSGDSVYSLLKLRIFTGRTHQIRVHLSSEGMPIIGDPIYSRKPERHGVKFLLLAATHLSFNHPVSGKNLDFSIDLPEHFNSFIKKIERNSSNED